MSEKFCLQGNAPDVLILRRKKASGKAGSKPALQPAGVEPYYALML